MKKIALSFIIFHLYFFFNVTIAQLVPYNYSENFETGNNPLLYWTQSPGTTFTVDSLFLTNSTSSSGNFSLKLDVTVNDTSNNPYWYLYWNIPLINPPNLDDSLFFSMDVKMDSISSKNIQIGYQILLLPMSSGVRGISTSIPYNTWTTISEQNLCRASNPDLLKWTSSMMYDGKPTDVGLKADYIGILMTGIGSQHYSLNIDNIILSGFILDTTVFNTNTVNNWAAYIARIKDSVQTQRTYYNNLTPPPDTTGANMCATFKLVYSKLKNNFLAMDSLLNYMDSQLFANSYFAPTYMLRLKNLFEEYQVLQFAYKTLMFTTTEIMVFNFPATEFHPLDGLNTPWSILDSSNTCYVRMCRGEKKPISFLLVPGCYTGAVTLDWDSLKSGANLIDKNAIDPYVAKIWYQGNFGEGNMGKSITQELLLKDDSLVIVDFNSGINYLRVLDTITYIKSYIDVTTPTAIFPENAMVLDSASLQPFIMDPERHKLIYAVLNIPENVPSGNYTTQIKFKDSTNKILKNFNLKIEVLPFNLDSSRLEYSLYYRGMLSNDSVYPITSEIKSKKQMKLELEDMKNHGVLHPNSYQPLPLLGESLELRNQSGLPKDKFYTEAFIASPDWLSNLPAFVAEIKRWKDTLFVYGYDTTNLYLFGYDEADSLTLISEIPAWTAARNAGAKIIAAGYSNTFSIVGSLLNTFNSVFGPLAPDAAQQVANYHSVGTKIFSYGCPWPLVENPEVYRRNNGCLLWQMGFDGSMEYAYQHAIGNFWNDFDVTPEAPYSEITFTYPTSDGIVQTIQWEGYREAINDVRYISTLLNIRDSLQNAGNNVTELNEWINNIDCTRPLEELRSDIIDKILELKSTIVSVKEEYKPIAPNKQLLFLYPNPASSPLIVTGNNQNSIATIYSLSGEMVQQISLEQKVSVINVSHLAKGFYIIKLQSEKEIIMNRFIKH